MLFLGVIGAEFEQLIPGLQPVPSTAEFPSTIARFNGILLGALSVALLVKRFKMTSAAILAAYCSAWLIAAHIPQIVLGSFEITRLVSLMEVASIVAALLILAFGGYDRSASLTRFGSIVFGCMLLLFAAVHFQYHDFIASMIPAWIPFAMVWPWLTASANLAAGLSFLTGVRTSICGALLGTMYISWVPIVHLPRIIAAPTNVEEWTACALAMTLAGAAWLVAGSVRGRGIDPVANLGRSVRRFVQQVSERRPTG